jgi:hypothetical protein
MIGPIRRSAVFCGEHGEKAPVEGPPDCVLTAGCFLGCRFEWFFESFSGLGGLEALGDTGVRVSTASLLCVILKLDPIHSQWFLVEYIGCLP